MWNTLSINHLNFWSDHSVPDINWSVYGLTTNKRDKTFWRLNIDCLRDVAKKFFITECCNNFLYLLYGNLKGWCITAVVERSNKVIYSYFVIIKKICVTTWYFEIQNWVLEWLFIYRFCTTVFSFFLFHLEDDLIWLTPLFNKELISSSFII